MNEDIREIFALIKTINERLDELLGPRFELPDDAKQAMEARQTANARGHHTVDTFAACIGRHPHWVSSRCKARVIRTLPGGKPYRIPLSEETRWNELPS